MTSGFTLIELIVTMFVIGLLTSLAAPRFAAMMPGANLRQATMVLAADLRGARNRSISGGKSVAIRFDMEERRYGSGAAGTRTNWPEKVQLEVLVPENMLDDTQQPQIWFYPDGSSSGGEILCSSAGKSYRVNVNWLAGWVAVKG
jgi:general secretion pathway protein H